MSDLLHDLRILLDGTKKIDKADLDAAIELLKQHYRKTNLKTEGSCLACHTHMVYADPSSVHLARGNEWLESVLGKWVWPPEIEQDHQGIRVNGYRPSTIASYICKTCHQELEELLELFREYMATKLDMDRQKQNEYEFAILSGQIKATPAKKYWLLSRRMTSQDSKVLSEMPYRDFLNTLYWRVVRDYVLWKRDHRCDLCNSNEKLNVHHKSYTHRGFEYQHLEDLTVLCRNCHAKFHGKASRSGGE